MLFNKLLYRKRLPTSNSFHHVVRSCKDPVLVILRDARYVLDHASTHSSAFHQEAELRDCHRLINKSFTKRLRKLLSDLVVI